jgi:hypothetical protein
MIEEHVQPHWEALPGTSAEQPHTLTRIGEEDARTVVNTLGDQFHTALAAAKQTYIDIWPKVPNNASSEHYRPHTAGRARKRHYYMRKEVIQRLFAARHPHTPLKPDHPNITAEHKQAVNELVAKTHQQTPQSQPRQHC